MKNARELVKVLKNMEKEMAKANLLMEQIDNVNDYIVEAYPFGKSFDELVLEVGEWVDKVEWNVDKDIEEKENKIIETIVNIGFGLGVDLEKHEDITYDMIFDGYLNSNLNSTKREIRKAVMEWIKDTKENFPELMVHYTL